MDNTPSDIWTDLDETTSQLDTLSVIRPNCNHRPGKFLGQTFSKNYERYLCADCGKEFSRYVENK